MNGRIQIASKLYIPSDAMYPVFVEHCFLMVPHRCWLWRFSLVLVIQGAIGFSIKISTLMVISTVRQKGSSHENFLQLLHTRGQAGSVIPVMEWELPAGSSVPASWLGLSCGQGIWAPQAWVCLGYVDHWLLDVQWSPGLNHYGWSPRHVLVAMGPC